jgi:glycosyltransferase involved in cell wall biosynthesis
MRPQVRFLSAVGGGPIGRIVSAIADLDAVHITAISCFSTVQWRRLRGSNRLRSTAARLAVFVVYPLHAVLAARGADVAVATTNPFWLPNLLLATRFIHRARLITLVYDVYPDSLNGLARVPRMVRVLMDFLNRHWMRGSSAVVFIGSGMRDELEGRYGLPHAGEVIVTGTDTSEFAQASQQPDLDEWVGDRILLTYIGNAGHVHDVDTLVDALKGLSESEQDRVAVLVSASGARAPELLRGIGGLTISRAEEALNDDRWRWVQRRSDISAVSLNRDAVTASMPSKFFSALGAGSAILSIAPEQSDLYQLTKRLQVGIAVEPGDSNLASARLREYIEDPAALRLAQKAAKEAAEQAFDMRILAQRWKQLILSVAEDGA